MGTKIESGTNWQLLENPASKKCVVCQNHALGITLSIKDDGKVLKIPVPYAADPLDMKGEGVFISVLKDEEGLPPQEFINIQNGGSLTLFSKNSDNILNIANSDE